MVAVQIHIGMWRSLVAHFVRDEGVGGSNPLIPTNQFLPPFLRPVALQRLLSIGASGFDLHPSGNRR